MSKIFDAYRKKVGRTSDLSAELGSIESVVLYPAPGGTQKNEFMRLAAQLQGGNSPNHGSVLSFASSTSGEGASFVSYNTAVVLAQAYQKRVAWIDGNFITPQPRLRDLDRLTFADMLRDPDRIDELHCFETVTLIPAGHQLGKVRGVFSTDKYTHLVAALAERFEFVIIDLPPILNASDSASMAIPTNGLVLVIEQKFLKREIIGHGLQGLRDKGVRVIGSVINRRSFELPKIIYDRL